MGRLPILVALQLLLNAGLCGSSLRLVHVLYRHGARTPTSQYPTDPNIGVWTQGLGQLTNEGKNNQLELGQFLRKRYDGFLPATYHLNYTLVRSTDVDRTLMSALANLAGLYPPQGDDVWNPMLSWQPIPVHTQSPDDDMLMRSYDNCDAYVVEENAIYHSAKVRDLDAEYQDVYDFVAKKSGSLVHDVKSLGSIFTTMSIEEANNLTVPDWARVVLPGRTEPVFPNIMSHLSDIKFQLYGATKKSRRLGGGPLVKDMVNHMSDAISGVLDPPSRRLFMYSGHDTSLAVVLPALRVFNSLTPPFAACLIVELHEHGDSGFFVNMLYRNGTTSDPYQLQVEGCDVHCPWNQFLDMMKEVIPDDIDKECQVDPVEYWENIRAMMI